MQKYERLRATHGTETDRVVALYVGKGGNSTKFKDVSIIHMYKRKGNPQVSDNHRGISLLYIDWKILAKIMLNRLSVHLDRTGLIRESQSGFRKDRGTIDVIFTARQLHEECQKQNVYLYMTFVDLVKAFDTVSRDELWKIMAKFDCPDS